MSKPKPKLPEIRISLIQTQTQKAMVARDNQAVLQASVEANTKCGKCGGGVRAMCEDAQDGDRLTADLEIKTSIYCRDAACGWQATQWRPWRVGAPKELGVADNKPDVLVSPETVELLKVRVGTLYEDPENGRGCQLCKHILEALSEKRALRPWPPGATAEAVEYPVEGQRRHVLLETGKCPT